MMKKNVGNVERVIRIVAGIVLVTFAFIGPKNPIFFLGLIPLLTGIFGWCPPYQLIGINTCKNKNS